MEVENKNIKIVEIFDASVENDIKIDENINNDNINNDDKTDINNNINNDDKTDIKTDENINVDLNDIESVEDFDDDESEDFDNINDINKSITTKCPFLANFRKYAVIIACILLIIVYLTFGAHCTVLTLFSLVLFCPFFRKSKIFSNILNTLFYAVLCIILIYSGYPSLAFSIFCLCVITKVF